MLSAAVAATSPGARSRTAWWRNELTSTAGGAQRRATGVSGTRGALVPDVVVWQTHLQRAVLDGRAVLIGDGVQLVAVA